MYCRNIGDNSDLMDELEEDKHQYSTNGKPFQDNEYHEYCKETDCNTWCVIILIVFGFILFGVTNIGFFGIVFGLAGLGVGVIYAEKKSDDKLRKADELKVTFASEDLQRNINERKMGDVIGKAGTIDVLHNMHKNIKSIKNPDSWDKL